jgi:predicted metal-binding membrane protein
MAAGLEQVLTRERRIVAVMLAAITGLAAWWTLSGGATGMSAWQMTAMTGPPGALIAGLPDMDMGPWSLGYAAVVFVMWWMMMVAMMVPSAAPVILLYAALTRDRGPGAPLQFLAGYLAIWAGFSALATALQGGLVALGWMTDMWMSLASPWLAALVLTAAGAYQFTSLKAACLKACRGPAETLIARRRSGRLAEFRMGLVHGRDCLGCCWGLMALLFVGGVMNLWWVLLVALLVALEKLLPWGQALSRPLGAALILAGAVLAWRGAALV